MQPSRRDIFKCAGAIATATGLAAAQRALAADQAPAHSGHGPALSPDAKGVLVDLTDCVGCRLCEYACKKANDTDPGPLAAYDDMSVFAQKRRPSTVSLTVVNAWQSAPQAKPVYAKVNCFHCNHAACVSACIVGALEKQPSGAVTYDPWKCIGCRYCMIACPFQIPAYEYDNAWTPQVKKCQFCQPRTSQGQLPACVQECPRQALTYGKRTDLVALAHRKITEFPDRYLHHVYGEHEVGGTSWLYLSPVPFEQAGFLSVGTAAPPALTEAIQHGVFKYWIAPVGWYAFLASMYWYTGRAARRESHEPSAAERHLHHPTHAAVGATALLDPPADGAAPESPAAPVVDHPPHAAGSPVSGAHHAAHPHPAPVPRKLLTPGVWALISLVVLGAAFGLYRFLFGLAAATNLDQQHPWGLWIAMDVGSGIALAGGGFVTAALVHVFHREHYHPVARSALLTALLGYTFYVPGLLADLGRWYNLWHPTIPTMWQGNSVLFEVGLCVMIYLNVQYAELFPIICERLIPQLGRFPRLRRYTQLAHDLLEKIMPALLVLGVCLSTFHQSSLGNLMVIAPYKLHPLWWTPMSPVFFLLSAMMVGFPMVIFTMLFGAWCLKRKPPMNVLSPLSVYAIVFLVAYLLVKLGDMVVRGTYSYLAQPSLVSIAWIVEMLGVVVPLIMLCRASVRRSPRLLGLATFTIILAVVLNRLNVFIIGFHPPYAQRTYFPSITEVALSISLVAALLLVYRIAVTYLPILDPAPAVEETPR